MSRVVSGMSCVVSRMPDILHHMSYVLRQNPSNFYEIHSDILRVWRVFWIHVGRSMDLYMNMWIDV